jgi:hypothetical protein
MFSEEVTLGKLSYPKPLKIGIRVVTFNTVMKSEVILDLTMNRVEFLEVVDKAYIYGKLKIIPQRR